MSTETQNQSIRSSRSATLWLLIAIVALIATACSTSDTLADVAASEETASAADEAGDASEEFTMTDEEEAMEEESVVAEADAASADGESIEVDAAAQPAGDAPTSASGSATQAQTPTELGREIIFTAALTIEVDDVAATGREATETISGLGGFVFGEESNGGAQPSTTLIFKVRPDDFSAALDQLGGIGELRSQNITTDDVTERVVDLQGRIDTTELGVERLRTAMEAAGNLEDFARLEELLLSRESDLEVLRGTLRTLRDQIDLATITLTIVQDEVRNGIEVNTSRYEGHDGGAGCPGTGGNTIEPGDEVTVCFELLNVGDQTLTDVTLTDSVLELDNDDLNVVFGDPSDLQPGQSLMLSYDLIPERTVNMRVAVVGTPTNGTSTDATGPVVRTNLSPRISVDQSSVSAGFGDGFDAATRLLSRLWVVAQVLAGFFIPMLIFVPFAWLALQGLRRMRRNRQEKKAEKKSNRSGPGFQEMPPPPNVAGA